MENNSHRSTHDGDAFDYTEKLIPVITMLLMLMICPRDMYLGGSCWQDGPHLPEIEQESKTFRTSPGPLGTCQTGAQRVKYGHDDRRRTARCARREEGPSRTTGAARRTHPAASVARPAARKEMNRLSEQMKTLR